MELIQVRIDPNIKRRFIELYPWHGAITLTVVRAITQAIRDKEAVQRGQQTRRVNGKVEQQSSEPNRRRRKRTNTVKSKVGKTTTSKKVRKHK